MSDAPTQKLLDALYHATEHPAQQTQSGWQCRCPAHEDRSPSLSVTTGDDGRALVKCHAGCSADAICKAVGLTLSDLMPPREPRRPANGKTSRIIATYDYRDEQDKLLYQVCRMEPKSFRQRRPDGKGGWDWSVQGVRQVPYRLPELLADPSRGVLIVEGEKDADALARLGLVATCNAGGAGKWRPEFAEQLRGQTVYVLPDNDNPGRQHAEQVARSLCGITASVRIVELPGLPAKGDVSDWLDVGGTVEQLKELVKAAPEWTPATAPTDWPDTNAPPPKEPPAPYRPFPVEALPEPVRGFVTAGSKSIGCDPAFIALPLLSVLGAAIGNSRRLRLKRTWHAPPIIWSVIVGESGTAKSPAFKLALKPIRDRQRKAFDQYKEAESEYKAAMLWHEKAMAEWKRDKTRTDDPPTPPDPPTPTRYVVSDTTVEGLAPVLKDNPKGLLLERDELAGWLGSFDKYSNGKGGDSAHWLSMFDGESIVVDRKTGTERVIHVPMASVCITGGIQPAILKRALGTEHRDSGMAARLLMCSPPRRPKKWTETELDPSVEDAIGQVIDNLLSLEMVEGDDGEPRPALVGLTPDAKAAFKTYYNGINEEMVDHAGERAAALAKLEGYAPRLALVIHFARAAADDPTLQSADVLDAESMNVGITLATWFKAESLRLYAMLSESEGERDHRRLVEWITNRGGAVTPRDVQMGCRRLRESGKAESALEELVKAGLGRWESSPTGQRGQPTRRFVFAPVNGVNVNSNTLNQGENGNTVDVDSVDATDATHWVGEI